MELPNNDFEGVNRIGAFTTYFKKCWNNLIAKVKCGS